MNWVLAVLLFQYVISATAGLVHQVRGPANVQRDQIVAAGKPIETGEKGFVEIQLNPGSYLRLRENSSAVFDSVLLQHIELRLIVGTMLVDSDTVNPDFPIKIMAGKLVGLIRKPGLYRFSMGSVRVLNGQLDLDNGTHVRKGYEAIASDDGVDVVALGEDEVRRAYAPDKIKIFVQPKEDENHHFRFMNSIFTELCSKELEHTRDVEVVSSRDRADFVLSASGGRQMSYRRVYASADLVQKSSGETVFSDTVTRTEYDQVFLEPSHEAVHLLILHILRKMHWR
jgi:hypothetical protein